MSIALATRAFFVFGTANYFGPEIDNLLSTELGVTNMYLEYAARGLVAGLMDTVATLATGGKFDAIYFITSAAAFTAAYAIEDLLWGSDTSGGPDPDPTGDSQGSEYEFESKAVQLAFQVVAFVAINMLLGMLMKKSS